MREQEFYTPDEAAEFLRVGTRMVYRLVYERRITHCKIGREIRLRRRDLEAYADSTTRPAVQ